MSVLLDAADRGVRVRILLDGWEPSWSGEEIAALSSHPRFEVRLFNPTLSRHVSALDLLRNPGRITHRMHNKAFIADRTLAVVGGRNVSDLYFGLRAAGNYRDLDLLVAGAVVGQVAASHEAFWNSDWSVALGAEPRQVRRGPPAPGLAKARDLAQQRLATAGDLPVIGRAPCRDRLCHQRTSRGLPVP